MDWPEELLEIFDDPLLADVRPKPNVKRILLGRRKFACWRMYVRNRRHRRPMTGWHRNCLKSTSGWKSMVANLQQMVA